jgi:hypothetical protein
MDGMDGMGACWIDLDSMVRSKVKTSKENVKQSVDAG